MKLRVNSRKHIVLRGRHKGLIKNNPIKVKKHNVGVWINTKTIEKDAIYDTVPTGEHTVTIDTDYYDPWDDHKKRGPKWPRVRVEPETKEVLRGYEYLPRPEWLNKKTGTRIKIEPTIFGNWGTYIKDNDDLVWIKIGKHGSFKYLYDMTIQYMKTHQRA